MRFQNNIFKILGKHLIKIVIVIALFIVPAIALIFKLNYSSIPNGWLLVIFIFFLAIERTWETFYSSKERKKHTLHGDWTLAIVSIAYIILVIAIIGEFFLLPHTQNVFISSLGLAIYISAFVLRIWGMQTLKDQWSVHAVGAQKVKETFLVALGPYRYVRHPIYLGVIGEVISMPLIWNTFYAFIFACLINIPLQIIRAYMEEASSIRKLGQDYVNYKKRVAAFIPFKIFTKK